MKKNAVKKKQARAGNRKPGYFGGKLMDRWDAAFKFRVNRLKKEFISCRDAMLKLRDDAGNQVFPDSVAAKQQWILQRRFTQLQADNFVEPTKGEIYVMLYEILYGIKTVVTKDGDKIEVDLEPNEKVMVIREMLKMGGHYAPEKKEHTGKDGEPIAVTFTFGAANLKSLIPDSKNRIKGVVN